MGAREAADRCRIEVTLTRTESISVEGPVDLSSQAAPGTERTATGVGPLGTSP